MANNRFQRKAFGASGAYTCACCGKKTRETGHDESSVDLCAFCYREAGEVNSYNDGNSTEEQLIRAVLALEVEYGRQSALPEVVEYHAKNDIALPKAKGVTENDQIALMRVLGVID